MNLTCTHIKLGANDNLWLIITIFILFKHTFHYKFIFFLVTISLLLTFQVRLEVMGKKAKNATFVSGTEKISKEVQKVEK